VPWAPDYVDSADLAEFVRVNADNPYVGTYGTAAARAVDDFCGRQFGRLESAGTFTYEAWKAARRQDGTYLLEVDDIPAADGTVVTVDGTAVTAGATGYRLWPLNALAKGSVATHLLLADKPYGDVLVTNRFGWLATPAAVTAAVWLQVNAWNVRRESPFGDAGNAASGTEIPVAGSRRLDPDARAMLGGLVRVRAAR
jgi:hypothetical protein